MTVGFKHWLTPKPGFFVAAETMISPQLALRFLHRITGKTNGVWNNATKVFSSIGLTCTGGSHGQHIHVWKGDPLTEAWGIVTDCSNGDYLIPALEYPSGSSIIFTLGSGLPLNLKTMFAELWDFYGLSKAYAVRYNYLWCTAEPAFLTNDHEVIHWDGPA